MCNIQNESMLNNEDKNIQLRSINNELIYFIKRKWYLFIIITFFSGIAGFIYAKIKPVKYESRLTFSLDVGSGEGSLSGTMDIAAQFGLGDGLGNGMFGGDNILEILKSRRIIEQVLLSSHNFENKRLTLVDFYLQNTKFKKKYESNKHEYEMLFPVGLAREKFTYWQNSILYDSYLDISKRYLSAMRPDKKTSIYEVKVISWNETFSKIFTDRVIEAAINFYTEISSKKERETLQVLEQRVASLKGDVGQSIESRAGTQDANINPVFAHAQSPVIKQQYNIQSYSRAYEEMFKTLEMARYQYLKKIPLLQVIDKADYPMKRIKHDPFLTTIVFIFVSVCIFLICVLFLITNKLGTKK
jgi:hypothetical protein